MGNCCPCPKRITNQQSSLEGLEETFQINDKIDDLAQRQQMAQSQKDCQDDIATIGPCIINSNSSHIQIKDTKLILPKLSLSKQQGPEYLANIDKTINHHQDINSVNNFQKEEKLPIFQKKNNAHILKGKTIKTKYNPQDYRFANETCAFRVKKIDSIKEQQFNIQNCRDSNFFLFDITANVYIDDCDNCVIFIAPCESTIFARNCKRLTVIVATKQFRTYECHDCIFSLYCKSQPVIQSSSNLKFSSFSAPLYSQLPQQFQKMRFQPWNNHWSEIHNFTKIKGQRHYQIYQYIDLRVIDWSRAFQDAGLTINSQQNYVPLIYGDLPYQAKSQTLILLNKEISDDQIKRAIKDVILLKAYQGILAGEMMVERKVLLLDILNFMPELFESMGTVYTSSSDIQVLKAKWLISFAVFKGQQP